MKFALVALSVRLVEPNLPLCHQTLMNQKIGDQVKFSFFGPVTSTPAEKY
jgi:hypothetical protein